MKKLTAAAALAGAALLAGPAAAQIPHFTPFAFEARGGVAVPTGDFGEVARNGFVVGGSITYHAVPLVGIYVGASYAQMPVIDVGDDYGDYKDTGFELGARVGIPTPLIPIDPWIKGGVAFRRLQLDVAGTETDAFDDWGIGYEVGAGLGFGFGPISITPGVGYVSYRVDDDGDDATVSYVKAEIGVRIRL
jgi:hypothetical protein